ncbi:MAG: class I SAM-dependent methyltransferase [Nanoarchaeota archaeon]|jgi:ubiquinone/menaquinone biosynthesis C-methylase UbiE|nr:class I SAM-dependent methyltransferase [Nanoarchaeota archaeon]
MGKTNMDYWKKLLEVMPVSYERWFNDEEIFLNNIVTENSKILDIGCGDGRSLQYILSKTERITGIDIDEPVILSIKKKFENNPDVFICYGDGRNLDYSENSFDYVMCMGATFGNLGIEKDLFLGEMKRVVNEVGEILLSVYNEDALSERLDAYAKVKVPIDRIENGKVFFEDICDIGISEQFSKDDLEEIFDRNGLKVIEIIKEGIGYFCRLKK